jgi:hypothetical protein
MPEPPKTSLYIVPTPIGNLADITLRAIEVLKSVDLILAEDTRTSSRLLKEYQISKPLQSFHNFNEHKIIESLLKRMENGEVMALISDAGTPGISDPGFLIVRETIRTNLLVECLPGPTFPLMDQGRNGLRIWKIAECDNHTLINRRLRVLQSFNQRRKTRWVAYVAKLGGGLTSKTWIWFF